MIESVHISPRTILRAEPLGSRPYPDLIESSNTGLPVMTSSAESSMWATVSTTLKNVLHNLVTAADEGPEQYQV
jgi:hypothetical protein